ncbi:hypothetical protein [Catellatospora sp. NPDC049133]|uniref:hypothetical protein n=1 Tax=Catellatospora sp. NPDC049133 TaxID=3155499 RepID=UPI0033FD87D2
MGNHVDPPLPVRASARDVELAKLTLEQAGWTLTAFVGACVRAVAAEPETVLGMLDKHRPEPKRRGRPPAEQRSTAAPNG